MIKKILDLHIHSKYSRACSGELELPKIAGACARKGIDIVATGDFTHPLWLEHIKDSLEEIGESGLYALKSQIPITNNQTNSNPPAGEQNPNVKTPTEIRFILSTEVSCIYKHKDKTRRLHLLILAPNIAAVEKLNKKLEQMDVNLKSDGRPIMGLSAKEVLKIILDIDDGFMLIPAHAWTPWFSIFGSKSGYDSLEECFEELTPRIKAIETGLSSDPPMNRRLSALDKITLISNSDAHGLNNLGREANVFCFADDADVNYGEITRIIKEGDGKKFLYTIEFYPEEGKYHFDGHLDCGVCFSPAETRRQKRLCPKCGKELTVGVLHRVEDLTDRAEKDIPSGKFIPHKYIVPLKEIIAEVYGVGVASKKVGKEHDNLLKKLGSEFSVLLQAEIGEIEAAANEKNIAKAIENMRKGKVSVVPGYDGKFGEIRTLGKGDKRTAQARLNF